MSQFIRRLLAVSVSFVALSTANVFAASTTVTYAPYIQPGDAGPIAGKTDQVVVAWQTNETVPNPSAYFVQFGAGVKLNMFAQVTGRVVDNYLAADPALPVPSHAYGAHVNYVAVLRNLKTDSDYSYKVTGPGLPAAGFTSSFATRKTGDHFAFTVMGDEGFFPVQNTGSYVTDYFARIVHLMYNADKIVLPGQPTRPAQEFAINTGDNIYNTGSEDSYRDFYFPVWNSDVDNADRGAPYIRKFKNYIVAGNHDFAGNGDHVNMMSTAGGVAYAGQTGGGDALAYFNNFYFPLNGPVGVDPYYVFNGDSATQTGPYFQLDGAGQQYTSPKALEAFRASTLVDSGKGATRQIDHMSNYSFDYGNTHFVFLNSNPHLFNASVPGGSIDSAPMTAFTPYPSILREWLINDLDSSDKAWKIVVYHHPAYSSGYATLRNNQMRQITQILQDHGVNIVYNGHEHNYQRTRPLRATASAALAPSSSLPAAVVMDTVFDGDHYDVPDGILHIVEGAGGNRDFDGDEANPRGSGVGLDQDDSATGTFVSNGISYPQGPGSWLDAHLTVPENKPFDSQAGNGSKLTVLFKAKVFSFGHIVVEGNKLTHYQITEPLQSSSSATAGDTAPYGTDFYGHAMNDPMADTLVNPANAQVVGSNPEGTPDLLDKWSIEKLDLSSSVTAQLVTQVYSLGKETVTITNKSPYALNGAQLVLDGAAYTGTADDTHTVFPGGVIITLGRIAAGATTTFDVPVLGNVKGVLRSSTAQPITIKTVKSK